MNLIPVSKIMDVYIGNIKLKNPYLLLSFSLYVTSKGDEHKFVKWNIILQYV